MSYKLIKPVAHWKYSIGPEMRYRDNDCFFNRAFLKEAGITAGWYVTFFSNDDGYLCLLFRREAAEGACLLRRVTKTGASLRCGCIALSKAGLKEGVYHITGRDEDIFITDAKLEPAE